MMTNPTIIAHIDGDSFFASCVQSVHPEFKSKPLVVGAERRVATAVSIEAKQLGVIRGMHVDEIKSKFPSCIIFDSDYRLYEMISAKMVAIIKQYSPILEVASVDEAYVDLSGYAANNGYLQVAQKMQNQIISSLGISVSIGVSVNKTLSKMASNAQKPRGFTPVFSKIIVLFLRSRPVDAICGIGRQYNGKFGRYGIKTAFDLYRQNMGFIKLFNNKTLLELYKELHGECVFPVDPHIKESFQSISKFSTFYAPSSDRRYLLSQLAHNIDLACFKAFTYKQAPRRVDCFLRLQTMRHVGCSVRLTTPTNVSGEIFKRIKPSFLRLINESASYRQTGVVLSDFVEDDYVQQDLFDSEDAKSQAIKKTIFAIKQKYGQKSIHWGQETDRSTNRRPSKAELFVTGRITG